MPIPFLYSGTTFAPWLLPPNDDTEPSDAEANVHRPIIPDFTQAELRQMILEALG